MLRERNDTIAAIATPLGEAGISMIRVSGSAAIETVERVFQGTISLFDAPSHTVHHGRVVHPNDGLVDDVLVSVFRRPRSYTGEDIVEISCHGSYYVSRKILETVIGSGARMADPGEFTHRAFLNGKMDLMQAEAVADLIHSKTALAHKASLEQLSGRLSAAINDLRQKVVDLCSLLELELDFAEEGIGLSDRQKTISFFDIVITELENLIRSYNSGKLIRDGVKVVLAGSPNVGKSSLLNVLLQESRAIVSDIPGTTRDVIEETVLIDGIAFRLVDTAGLRLTTDVIEREGVKRSNDQINSADLILYLIDSSSPADPEFENSLGFLKEHKEKIILVINKIDVGRPKLSALAYDKIETVSISCKTKEGIDSLEKKLSNWVLNQFDSNSSSIKIQSDRHRKLLKATRDSLISARSACANNLGNELIAIDLRGALNSLGEIIGLTTPDDILNNIFSQFCIGK
ncbi:MAG TPA: tRNA uridine-5-carboxymethylaminomethyl(34) synthesis GTPase MnmE [Bacteroidota bacterium]|nr:tRNA uridine-5-carboxymethylaminomethyl(34) synthesis GTPase MnmE [Bacteroidota bacterium]